MIIIAQQAIATNLDTPRIDSCIVFLLYDNMWFASTGRFYYIMNLRPSQTHQPKAHSTSTARPDATSTARPDVTSTARPDVTSTARADVTSRARADVIIRK